MRPASAPDPTNMGAARRDRSEPDQLHHVSGQANKPLSSPPHALPIAPFVAEIEANAEDGLTREEAKVRLEEYGRNELGEAKGVQPIKIFIGQIANAMTLVSPRPAS